MLFTIKIICYTTGQVAFTEKLQKQGNLDDFISNYPVIFTSRNILYYLFYTLKYFKHGYNCTQLC